MFKRIFHAIWDNRVVSVLFVATTINSFSLILSAQTSQSLLTLQALSHKQHLNATERHMSVTERLQLELLDQRNQLREQWSRLAELQGRLDSRCAP